MRKAQGNGMPFFIRKTAGYKQEFNIKKFKRSLRRVGADQKLINQIIDAIHKKKPRTTKEIHNIALAILAKKEPSIAARYNLKRALMELGPGGYLFEQFIAKLLKHQGYKVTTNPVISGACVDHEIDINAQRASKHFMIECKFHNRPGLKSDVKVTLYIQARFEDIDKAWQKDLQDSHEFHQAWIVTNTQFTTEAIKYATCKKIRLLSWAYPKGKGLAATIDKLGLHPITALTSLTKLQKKLFLKDGLVLCRDIRKHIELLKRLGYSPRTIEKLIEESEAVCNL